MNSRSPDTRLLCQILAATLCTAWVTGFPTASAETAALEGTADETPAIELGAPFSNNAILQRGDAVPVWGWSEPGTEVSVEFAGQRKSTTAGGDGKWMVKLDPLEASAEGRRMTIEEESGRTLVLTDILVGEVWMASGQSNMQWTVGKSTAARLVERIKEQVGEDGQLPPIREFKITNYFAHLHPIEHASGAWDLDYNEFSAIAFAFAHKLYEELGVPIGILNCSFSETSIEAWTPRIGFQDSESEFNRGIEALLLETDPSTPEHKRAWEDFYKSILDAVEHNQALADRGENQFVAPPTGRTPGNMSGNRDSTWLFNARLNPVIPYAINGCIWNQGYANMGKGLTYYDNLHALVRGWRTCWGKPELPVYFHQFYSPGNDVSTGPNHPEIGGAAEMRLGTWMARDIPHTGMASQIDIQGAIHYGHKTVPGQRLALHALKNQYAKEVVADGPMFRSYEVEGDNLIVSFDHAEGGLVVADVSYNANPNNDGATGFADPKIIEEGDDQVRLFYLAGEDRIWHPAKVRISGDRAVVSSAAVKEPRGVAYGTGGIGFQPNLYNTALLPTTPFIVFDHKPVISSTWPDSPLKIAGVEVDPTSVGLLNEYRKMPILSTQFRDHAVLQADRPVTIWGSAVHDWGFDAEGEAVIHFHFDGREEAIPVANGMKQWSVTLPPMEASDRPHTLKVSLTIDGELAHERVVENIVIGDVWYVAGSGNQQISDRDAPVSGPLRIMTRMAKSFMHPTERPYSVAISTTPDNRFASYWGEPAEDGFAASLARAIHAKTGRPVGIIYMQATGLELKHWMDVPSLANAPSLRADYEDIAAVTPGTPFYTHNAERYIADWRKYWGEYIPAMIATKAVPDGAAWGSFPTFASSVETDATQAYNCLVASFRRTQLKGIVFMTERSMVETGDGAHFGSEMSALANGWKRLFKGEGDPHFVYTIPSVSLAARITRPEDIEGASTPFEIGTWLELSGKQASPSDRESMEGLLEAVIEAAY